MEHNGGVTPTLLAIRTTEESARILKATLCLLKCFFFLDICYLLAALSMVVMALSTQIGDKDQLLCGGFFSIFAVISAMCNRWGICVLTTSDSFVLVWPDMGWEFGGESWSYRGSCFTPGYWGFLSFILSTLCLQQTSTSSFTKSSFSLESSQFSPAGDRWTDSLQSWPSLDLLR